MEGGPVPLVLMIMLAGWFPQAWHTDRIGLPPMEKLPCPRVGRYFAACDMPRSTSLPRQAGQAGQVLHGGGICTVMRHMRHKVNREPKKYCVVCVVIPPGDASRTLLSLPKSCPVCLESLR